MTLSTLMTWNLVFKGVIGGLITSLIAMGIVLVYRSSRVINFAVGSMFSFVLGIGLYGLTYLFPVYLAQIRGYNALMIGETMFVSGIAMFLTAPIAGRLMPYVDKRLMLMVGFLFFAG